MIEFDLNSNDAETLRRHAESFKPASGDASPRQTLAFGMS